MRSALLGAAAGGAVCGLELVLLRVAYVGRADRAALLGGLVALLVVAGAAVAVLLRAADGIGALAARWLSGAAGGAETSGTASLLRAMATAAVTAPAWAPAAWRVGVARGPLSRVATTTLAALCAVAAARLARAWLGRSLGPHARPPAVAREVASQVAAERGRVLVVAAAAAGARRAVAAERWPPPAVGVAAALAVAAFAVDALAWHRRYPELHALLGALAYLGALGALTVAAAALAPSAGAGSALAAAPRGSATARRELGWLMVIVALAPAAAAGLRASTTTWFIAHHQTALARDVLDVTSHLGALTERALRPAATATADASPGRRAPQRRSVVAQSGAGAPLPVARDAHLLLITVDALRPDHLDAYGYGRRDHGEPLAPAVAALAARGVRFERAYAQAPHSAYSIASLLSSEYVHATVRLGLPLPPTLPDLLGARGIRTEAFFPLGLFFNGRAELAPLAERRFGFERSDTRDLDARALTDRVLERLDEIRREGEPRTFLWVHYFDVHEPYVRHPEHDFGPSPVDRYDSEIAFFDRELARLVAALDRLDRPTVIALTADHGEEFKEHGGWYHGSSVYEEQVRVPLVIVAPGLAPRVVRGAVELVDVAPTLMELLGEGAPATLRGDDLGPALVGDGEPVRPVFAEVDTRRMVVSGRWKLIEDVRRGTVELYDLAADPGELSTVYDREPQVAARLEGELQDWVDGIAAPEATPAAPSRSTAPTLPAAPPSAAPGPAASPPYGAAPPASAPSTAAGAAPPSAASTASGAASPSAASTAPRAAPPRSPASTLARARLGDRRTVADLARLVADPAQPEATRAAAASLVGALEGYAARDALRAVVAARPPARSPSTVEAESALALGELTDRRALPTLVALLEDARFRERAAVMLGRLRDPRAAAALAALVADRRDPDRELRRRAIHYLGFVGDAAALAPLEAAAAELKSRSVVVLALARIGARLRTSAAPADVRAGDAVLPVLLGLLARETYEDSRATLLLALGLLGDPAALPAARAAALADPPVKWASETLVRLGALARGVAAGVDFAPGAPGLDGGFSRCARRAPDDGGWTVDNYAGATTCELASRGTVTFALPSPPAHPTLLLRLVARAPGASLRLVVNGAPLAPLAAPPAWRELRVPVDARLLRAGTNRVSLELSPGAAAEVDHLLVL